MGRSRIAFLAVQAPCELGRSKPRRTAPSKSGWLSRSPRPEGVRYASAADVSVHVRTTPPSFDGLRSDQDGVWLSVACLPLTGDMEIEPIAVPYLRATMSRPESIRARQVRVSDFTPGTWCQFGAAMSLVRVTGLDEDARKISAIIPVEPLVATSADQGRTLRLGVEGRTLKTIGLAAMDVPDVDSQLEQCIAPFSRATATTRSTGCGNGS